MSNYVKVEISIHPDVMKAMKLICSFYEEDLNCYINAALYHYVYTEADNGFEKARDKIKELLTDP